jgi:hypothetical protein
MGLESYIKQKATEFETWRGSPELHDKIEDEKGEFWEQLNETGTSARDFVYKDIIKNVLWGTVSDEARSAFSGKYNMLDSFGRTSKRVANASWSGLKVMGQVAGVAGKALKIGSLKMLTK